MLMTHSVHSSHVPVNVPGCETEPTPEEISRRVDAIRSSWDVEERMARRHVAQDRFECLIATLIGGHAA